MRTNEWRVAHGDFVTFLCRPFLLSPESASGRGIVAFKVRRCGHMFVRCAMCMTTFTRNGHFSEKRPHGIAI